MPKRVAAMNVDKKYGGNENPKSGQLRASKQLDKSGFPGKLLHKTLMEISLMNLSNLMEIFLMNLSNQT